MIDTISLVLSERNYKILDTSKFKLITSQRGVSRRVLNPTKQDYTKGLHYPRLTLINRFNRGGWQEQTLQIQVSLPKMLYGNNFDELSESDFEEVLAKFVTFLDLRGIEVHSEDLRKARVRTIHYGKNFVYTDGTTPKMVIDKIAQGNYSLRLDTEMTKYRNNGLNWKLHTNSWELAFYDKKAELQKAKISEARSEEKDSAEQMKLFDEPKKYRPFEVLRMELRLNNRVKIKHAFKLANIEVPLTFENMYAENVTKKILQHYLGMVEDARPKLLDYRASSDDDALAELSIKNHALSPANMLAIAYLKYKIDHGDTLRAIRETVTNGADWQGRRLMKQAKEAHVSQNEQPFAYLWSEIREYKATRLADYDITIFE